MANVEWADAMRPREASGVARVADRVAQGHAHGVGRAHTAEEQQRKPEAAAQPEPEDARAVGEDRQQRAAAVAAVGQHPAPEPEHEQRHEPRQPGEPELKRVAGRLEELPRQRCAHHLVAAGREDLGRPEQPVIAVAQDGPGAAKRGRTTVRHGLRTWSSVDTPGALVGEPGPARPGPGQ